MKLAALVLVVASTAYASQEQIHTPKQVTLVAATQLFGDVEVAATADTDGHVATLVIKVNGATITVPAKWLGTLPKLNVKTIEIRSEVGYDPKPWLYVVFDGELQSKAVKRRLIHIAIHDGKLDHAEVDVTTTRDEIQHAEIKAP